MQKKIDKKLVLSRIKAKKLDASVNITFRIPRSLRDKLEKQCANSGVSMNEVVRELIEMFTDE